MGKIKDSWRKDFYFGFRILSLQTFMVSQQIIGDIVGHKYDAIIFRSVQNKALKNIGIILR